MNTKISDSNRHTKVYPTAKYIDDASMFHNENNGNLLQSDGKLSSSFPSSTLKQHVNSEKLQIQFTERAAHNQQNFRPNNTINIHGSNISNVAELILKDELEDTMARVTTGRPTIIIYPTGMISLCINSSIMDCIICATSIMILVFTHINYFFQFHRKQ